MLIDRFPFVIASLIPERHGFCRLWSLPLLLRLCRDVFEMQSLQEVCVQQGSDRSRHWEFSLKVTFLNGTLSQIFTFCLKALALFFFCEMDHFAIGFFC